MGAATTDAVLMVQDTPRVFHACQRRSPARLARIVSESDRALFADQRAAVGRFLRSERARDLARRTAPIAVFLVALWVRLRFVEEHPPGLYVVSDMEFYDRRADHLLSGGLTIWDTFTPVGYPALLALIYAVIG